MAPMPIEPKPHKATTAVDTKAELQRLRRRNEELQSQVDKLLLNARSQNQSKFAGSCSDEMSLPPSCSLNDGLHVENKLSTKQPKPNSTASEGNTHSGLHHRRIIAKASHVEDGIVTSGEEPGHKKTQILVTHDLCSPIHVMSICSDEEDGRLPDVQNADASSSNPNNDDADTDEEPENDDASHNKHLLKTKKHVSHRSGSSSPSNSSAFPPFIEQLKDRAGWLIGLLILQSCSSFIIQYNERFLQKHMIIVQFLTMLVGAGGNAGNQASVRVIRSLAVGTLNKRTMRSFLLSEAKMALCLSILIGMTGFIRAAMFRTPPGETIAVTASVCAIVAISVAIGCTLPLGMRRVGIDPAHSSTSIQVVMDILGVLITVCVSTFVMSLRVFQSNEDTMEDDDLATI
jgi:cation transporter-like permease